MVSREFIHAHLQDQVNNLALHRSQHKDLSDEDWQFFLQQIEGYQRTADKLPLFGEMAKRRDGEGWWFPPRISCEQCSSEFTAKYKATLVSGHHLIDLTGGAGVDTYFLSQQFDTVDYVEQNPDLCHLAEHNLPKHVSIHNCSAEHYLSTFHFQLPSTSIPPGGIKMEARSSACPTARPMSSSCCPRCVSWPPPFSSSSPPCWISPRPYVS